MVGLSGVRYNWFWWGFIFTHVSISWYRIMLRQESTKQYIYKGSKPTLPISLLMSTRDPHTLEQTSAFLMGVTTVFLFVNASLNYTKLI